MFSCSQMLPEMTLYAEWLAANKQNRLEWVLLGAEEWAWFANSTVRQVCVPKLKKKSLVNLVVLTNN